jgi:hypothetical protein
VIPEIEKTNTVDGLVSVLNNKLFPGLNSPFTVAQACTISGPKKAFDRVRLQYTAGRTIAAVTDETVPARPRRFASRNIGSGIGILNATEPGDYAAADFVEDVRKAVGNLHDELTSASTPGARDPR